jgi:hypothetical protein
LYDLDLKWYRQEVSYKKQKQFKSAIIDDYYSEDDLFVKLDEYELEMLSRIIHQEITTKKFKNENGWSYHLVGFNWIYWGLCELLGVLE